MQVSVTFKNIDPSDALRTYIEKKLDKIDKLLDNPAEANVVFSVEKIRHTTEVNLTCDRMTIHASEETGSMYSSIDMVIDKIRTQIDKNKKKIQRKKTQNRESIKTGPRVEEEEIPPEDEESESLVLQNG